MQANIIDNLTYFKFFLSLALISPPKFLLKPLIENSSLEFLWFLSVLYNINIHESSQERFESNF